MSSENAAGAHIGPGVEGTVQAVDHDAHTRGGGVDKFPAANVDAYVGGRLAAIGLEHHQIAGLQLPTGDGISVVQLPGGGALNADAKLLVSFQAIIPGGSNSLVV